MSDNPTEKELVQEITSIVVGATAHPTKIVDLIIDLIAEQLEEKAEEAIDKHERNWEHGREY